MLIKCAFSDILNEINNLILVTGHKVKYNYVEPPANSHNEMVNMVILFNKHGYYKKGLDDLSLARKINPQMGDVEEFLKRTKYNPENFAQK